MGTHPPEISSNTTQRINKYQHQKDTKQMNNIREQVEEVSAKLLRGELTQEEALRQQRQILGQPDPTPEPESTPAEAIALSVESKAATVIGRCDAEMADAAAKLKENRDKVVQINLERDRLAGAIAAAESKQRISSGNSSVYKREKAALIAKGLLGEKVDLADLQTPAEDFADNVSAQDLAMGLAALRAQLSEIERRRMSFESERRRLTHEYCTASGTAASIRFMLLANNMASEYCNIRAAHMLSQQNGNQFCTIAPESLTLLTIHNPLSWDLIKETGLGKREINGRVLEESHSVRNAMASLVADMEA